MREQLCRLDISAAVYCKALKQNVCKWGCLAPLAQPSPIDNTLYCVWNEVWSSFFSSFSLWWLKWTYSVRLTLIRKAPKESVMKNLKCSTSHKFAVCCYPTIYHAYEKTHTPLPSPWLLLCFCDYCVEFKSLTHSILSDVNWWQLTFDET